MSKFYHHLIVTIFLLASAFPSAANVADSLATVANRSKGNERIDLLNKLAVHLFATDPKKVDSILTITAKLSDEAHYAQGAVKSCIVGARLRVKEYKYGEAEQKMLHALNIALADDNSKLMAEVYLDLGSIELMTSKHDVAFEHYLKGLTKAKEANEPELQVTLLMNLGRVKEMLGDLDKAGEYAVEALSLCDTHDLKFRKGQVFINLAVLEYKRHNLGLSVNYNQEALKLFTELNDRAQSAICLSNLGFAENELGNKQKALEYYERSLEIRRQIGDRHGIGVVLLYKAELLVENRSAEAEKLAVEALAIAKETNDLQLLSKSYTFLYGWNEKKGNSAAALKYFKELSAVTDSIDVKAHRNKILELEAAYQFQEFQNRTDAQNKQMALMISASRQRNIAIIILVILLAIGVVGFLTYRNRMKGTLFTITEKEQDVRMRFEQVSEELSSERKRVSASTDKIVEQSTKDNGTNGSESVKELLKLIDKMSSGAIEEKDWITFNVLFESANPGFVGKLRKAHPDLTINDVRLVSLIRTKLSNKQIGNVLNISRDSVVRAKYRMRQKFDLASNKELETTISSM